MFWKFIDVHQWFCFNLKKKTKDPSTSNHSPSENIKSCDNKTFVIIQCTWVQNGWTHLSPCTLSWVKNSLICSCQQEISDSENIQIDETRGGNRQGRFMWPEHRLVSCSGAIKAQTHAHTQHTIKHLTHIISDNESRQNTDNMFFSKPRTRQNH